MCAEDMLDPDAQRGFRPVALHGLAFLGFAPLSFPMDVACQLSGFEQRLEPGRAPGGVGPDPGTGSVARQQRVHRLAMMRGGVGDVLQPDQLVFAIHIAPGTVEIHRELMTAEHKDGGKAAVCLVGPHGDAFELF